MNNERIGSELKDLIEPQHLLRAIENCLAHSGETSHAVTGLTFRRYIIIVRRRKGLSFHIEFKFKKNGEKGTWSKGMRPS